MPFTAQRRCLVLALGIALMPAAAPAQAVARLIVKPIALRLEPGTARDVNVEAYDAADNLIALERAGVTFASSDTTVAVVSASGTVLGVRTGRADVFIRAGTQSRGISVTVGAIGPGPTSSTGLEGSSTGLPGSTTEAASTGPAVVSAVIEPSSIQLLPTERFKPVFRLRFADGTSAEASDVTWTPFNTPIGFDQATREVIGVLPGTGVLGGQYGRITASVQVTVGDVNLVPDHDSLLLVAGALDTVRMLMPTQAKRVVTQNLTFKTTDPAVLRVLNPAVGIVQARDGGTADLIIDGYGVIRRLFVRVTPRIARVEATIPAGTLVTLGAGGSVPLDAKAIGTAGTPLTTVALTFRSQDTTIARVDARGVVTGMREGSTRLTLDAPGLEQLSWPVTVAATSVTMRVKAFALQSAILKPLVAHLRGADQRDYGSASAPQWSSSNRDVATVDGSGTVSARGPGRATIVVTQQGAGADSATVFVTGRALISGSIGGARGIWQLLGPNDSTPIPLVPGDSGMLTQATWSPDRTRIAATLESSEKSQPSRVVVMDADGTHWRIVSPDLMLASDPAWTSDGAAVLMAVRDSKTSSIVRVALGGGTPVTLVSVFEGRVRHPVPGSDTGTVIVRMEKNGAVDLARVRDGSLQLLTTTKPREELLAPLRDGRLLVAIDSSAKSRPSTLQWITVATDGIEISTPIQIPTGLVITDVSAGYDDGSAMLVARARSWPGMPNPVIVVLRVALDGSAPRVVMILPEKDAITVRSD